MSQNVSQTISFCEAEQVIEADCLIKAEYVNCLSSKAFETDLHTRQVRNKNWYFKQSRPKVWRLNWEQTIIINVGQQ